MLERTTGIEPASSAWEADILPMNYVRACICLASVLPTPAARPLKCHALKRCTFWRETYLAFVFALRLVNQRARATSHCARTLARTLSGSVGALRLANRLRSGICLASVLPMPAARPLKCHALKRCTFWRETCLASVFASWLVISGLGLQVTVQEHYTTVRTIIQFFL